MNTHARNYSDTVAAGSIDASNKNISSVLSQIQDEGPAYSEARERDNLVNLKTENKRNSNTSSSIDLDEKALYSGGSTNFGNSSNGQKKPWIQYLVVLSLTVSVMFFIYKMDDRANKIETLLSDYDEEIQDTIESYNNESSVIKQLNADFASIKNELKLISPNSNTDIKETVKINNVDIQDEIVSSLEDEIQVLKMQLDKANSDLKIRISKNETVSVDKNSIKNIKPEKQLTTSWKVNLAALSNKRKVDEIVNQLSTDGLKPSIDKVTVNGNLIYRLSVGGFSEFEQAELFVIIAEEEYGMKGGWIKKVSNG